MSVPMVELAKAVVTALNAHTGFSVSITAARTYRPIEKLQELSTVAVTVVPHGDETAPRARGTDATQCLIDVAIQRKLTGNDDTDLATRLADTDTLMALVDEIKRFLGKANYTLSGLGAWPCVEVANTPAYDVKHWQELGVFTSVVMLTFHGVRTVA